MRFRFVPALAGLCVLFGSAGLDAQSMDAPLALPEAIKRAIEQQPELQGFLFDLRAQFTCSEFVSVLKSRNIRISMDGKGRWRDNVFVERLWRSVKYEEVYLRAYESVSAARAGIARYMRFFNTRRPHTALDRRTPDSVYFGSLPLAAAA